MAAEQDGRQRLFRLVAIAAVLTVGLYGFQWFQEWQQGNQGKAETVPKASEGDAKSKTPVPDAKPQPQPTAANEAERRKSERKASIETKDFKATFSNLNTGLTSFSVKDPRFVNDDGVAHDLVTTDKEQYFPFQANLAGLKAERSPIWSVETVSKTALRFHWSDDSVAATRKLEAGKSPYQLWSTMRITNRGTTAQKVQLDLSTHHYVSRDQEDSGFFFAMRSPWTSFGICRHGDETTREDRDELLEEQTLRKDVTFAGTENTYFASLIAPSGKAKAATCELGSSNRGGTADEPHGSLFESRIGYPTATLEPGESVSYRTLFYIGPKLTKPLTAAGHGLSHAIDLGFFSIIASQLTRLLTWIQGSVNNWGLAIILLTLLVKIVLYPLTEKSFRSMARMRLLKPEMDRINELYKDDREKKGAAIMELYRKYKINPVSGCLPQLLQLPIWWALYTSLLTNVELYHAPFALWLTDLSAPDPFYILPLSLGGLMFLQQKITPSTMDPAQAKMMLYVMPAMITSLMLLLPAGLCLYMITNSTLGIAQQQFIQHRLAKAEANKNSDPESGSEPEPNNDNPKKTAAGRSTKSHRTRARVGQRRQRRGRA